MELITDTEAEQRIISAMLHSESACIEAVATIDEDEFYRPLHRDIFLLTKDLYIRGVKPTLVEVFKEGQDLGFIENTEDIEELRYIAGHYIEDENIGYWVNRVRQASKGRKAQKLLLKYNYEIEQENVDIGGFIQRAGSDFMALAMDADSENIETAQEVAQYGTQLVATNVERWRKSQEEAKFYGQIPLEGVPTGLKHLDGLTLGYKPGDLIILGAQTGHGKTAFALNTSMAVCVDNKKPLLYINTEMSKKQVTYRWGSIISQIPLKKIRSGSLTNEELKQVLQSYELLSESGFNTAYMPNLTPDKLQTLTRKAKLQCDIQLLILDYVGRMEKVQRGMEEWQVLEQVVKNMKLLAQNLDIACMVLVQLNPDGTLQGAKRMKNECDLMLKLLPMCDDLKDQEALEKAQEKYQKKYNRVYENFNYRLWLDKSRDSEAGLSIPIVFDQERQQMRQAVEVKTDHWNEVGKEVKGGRKCD